MVVHINSLLNIKAWTPIAEVGFCVSFYFDGVYKLDDCLYLTTQEYDENFEVGLNGPFVTKLYWGGESSMKYALLNQLANDVDINCSTPPQEISCGTTGLYHEILALTRSSKELCTERAIYSSSGSFIHKTIRIGRDEFYFRSISDYLDERAYLIGVFLN